jgi:hypothetical protein
MRIAPLVVLSALAAVGQQAQPQATFKVTSQLVIVNVAVRDSEGHPIPNLKASDFTLSEDDKPQKVSVFEYQKLDSTPLAPLEPPPTLKTRAPAPAPKPPADGAVLRFFLDGAGRADPGPEGGH